MMDLRSWIRKRVSEVVGDDTKRFQLQMVWALRIVALISLVMTVVNLITGEYSASILTGGYAGVGFLCTWLMGILPQRKDVPFLVLLLAFFALFVHFLDICTDLILF